MAKLSRSDFLAAAGAAGLTAALPLRARAAGLDRIGVDYAYYNPPSLVLKSKGWLDEALAKRGTAVDWVLSLGSNKANGFLAAGAVQFGSTAGSAALLARANGSPIKTVFLYSRPEWTALVVPKDSPFKSVRDLKGKKVAATRGTDPWFFLLRSLQGAGLQPGDVQLVDLQHPDGRTALERGQVDAWAGLDPHMAASQLDAGSRLLYRNVAFNTWGALNAREDFVAQHPDVATIVLSAYDRARKYAASHVEETAALLSDASHTEKRVAELQLRERTTYPGNGTPGNDYHDAIAGVVPLIRADKLAKPDADLEGALASLIDARLAATALRG
ncbi:MAG TPA: aliphatic sulfonate ABC transporter substrate-binding protein [Candidatus Elarobacter sp.]|jgi:sulfonate transport system substrate-binding protein|nr:aliphatic sulfonate ABC transporter substrate-binding protein [Candidatus Elarobacter sp.]